MCNLTNIAERLATAIADGIARGEERKAEAIKRAAEATRLAKQDAAPVVVFQCPNEVLERLGRRVQQKW
jgi:hypothetical protein